jgi:FADH2 O2-dependent halogenase
LTLLGLSRLLKILGQTDAGAERDAALSAYERTTLAELDITERLVGALYATMDDPALFKRLSLLYFAAASFSETVRRLGREDLAPGFLLCGNAAFARELAACTDAALGRPTERERRALEARIDAAIEPYDAAGLLDRTRRHWHPVMADDLLASAGKLGATAAEVHRLLVRSGFTMQSGIRE